MASQGPAVIFLHAVTRDRSDFDEMRARLAAPSASLDLPGHGEGPRLPRYTVVAMAQALTLPAGAPPVIYGHSMGGCVALHYAAMHPERVAALVLEEPPLFAMVPPRAGSGHYHRGFVALRDLMTGPAAGRTIDEWEHDVGGWGSGHGRTSLLEALGETAVRRRARQLAAFDPGVLGELIDWTVGEGFDPAGSLARIACPVAVLAGEPALGSVLTGEDRSALEAISGMRVIPVANEGHFIHEVLPDVCLAPVEDMLQLARER